MTTLDNAKPSTQAILAVEHQRLVKYPLLLEQLAKQTPLQQQQPQAVSEDGSGGAASEVVVATSASPEAAVIKRCVDRSREILECIDQQVADVQNKQKLAEIQGNIDTSGLERMPDHPITAEYRVRLVSKIVVYVLVKAYMYKWR